MSSLNYEGITKTFSLQLLIMMMTLPPGVFKDFPLLRQPKTVSVYIQNVKYDIHKFTVVLSNTTSYFNWQPLSKKIDQMLRSDHIKYSCKSFSVQWKDLTNQMKQESDPGAFMYRIKFLQLFFFSTFVFQRQLSKGNCALTRVNSF